MIQILKSRLLLIGDFTSFVAETIFYLRRLWFRRSLFLRHCEYIGVSSTPIILVAGFFLGAVLGYQLYEGFHRFGAEALLGGSIGVALFRELGPVMTAVMVTGRAGAAMAAEIATMKITEQVDALEVMAINPVEYLVTPRVSAGLVMMPILGLVFCVVACFSGGLIACGVMNLSVATYYAQLTKWVDTIEIIHCMVKSATFGLVLTLVGCYCGYVAQGGARAVGYATRTTVVVSLLGVLLMDYVLTSLLPFGYPFLKAG